ncbi:hypothetical protein M2266_005186 [Streptomyces sp. SPB162]|nr:hypothetical protein [Streptomyces sp. SPB162]
MLRRSRIPAAKDDHGCGLWINLGLEKLSFRTPPVTYTFPGDPGHWIDFARPATDFLVKGGRAPRSLVARRVGASGATAVRPPR